MLIPPSGFHFRPAVVAMAISEYKYLTPEQREHFLEHGWVQIPKAVKEEHRRAFTENVWVRLGYDPEDKSTWAKEKVSFESSGDGSRQVPERLIST